MSVFASIGATVTCVNGHEICTVAEDLSPAAVMSVTSMKDWRNGNVAPQFGEEVKPCAVCGAPYIEPSMRGGYSLHVNGEWLP